MLRFAAAALSVIGLTSLAPAAGAGEPPAERAAAPPQPAPKSAGDGTFELRAIDRATVRVFTVKGVTGRWARSKKGAQGTRFVAVAEGSHGTGVLISADGVVLTAKHVIGDDPLVAVMLAGEDDALPAHVLYRDPKFDIAFLKVDAGKLPFVALPATAPTLRAMQRVSVSGYPVDTRERLPAASSGEISRRNNDGRLQVAMSLNSGNSGGALIDDTGQILGIVTHRGNLERGVQGIVLVEPVARIITAYDGHVKAASRPAPFAAEWTDQLAALARWLHDGPFALSMRSADAAQLRILAAESAPEVQVVLAARVWNSVQGELEQRGLSSVEELPKAEAKRAKAQLLAVQEVCKSVATTVGPQWRFANQVAAADDVRPSAFRGPASSTRLRRQRVLREGILPVEGGLTVHIATIFSPLFGIGIGVGGHAAVFRYGKERGSQFLMFAGGTINVGTSLSSEFADVIMAGSLDVGIGGRFGSFQLAAYYAPGVSLVFGRDHWSWEGFRIEAGSTLGRSINYGTAFTQIGHPDGPIRALSGYLQIAF